MATTPTTKLGIPLPVAGSGEPFTVAAYNFGINTLDGAAGSTIVTSVSRPGSPFAGQVIYETDTELSFVWDGSTWKPSGGGGGNVADDCIQPNFNTISNNYTFDTGYNGVSAGPITIASGVTVTVPVGSAWSIV